jgi:hypothetical protein
MSTPNEAPLTDAEKAKHDHDQEVLPYKVALVLLLTMLGCITAGAVTVAMALWQAWQPAFLFPLVLLLFIIGFYRWVWLRDRFHIHDTQLKNGVVIGELVMLVLIARLFAYLADPNQFSQDLPAIPKDPTRLLKGEFWIYLPALLASWWFGRGAAKHVSVLYLRPKEVNKKQDDEINSSMLVESDRYTAYTTLSLSWRWGIVVMLAYTIFVLFYREPTPNIGPLALRPQIILLTLLYFVVGLLWNAWSRLRYLRTMWQTRKLNEPPELVWRWSRYLLFLLLIAAIPAIVLPAGYSFNPFGFLDGLFGVGPQNTSSKAIPPTPFSGDLGMTPLAPPLPANYNSNPIDLSGFFTALFWTITVMVLVYVLQVLSRTGLGNFRMPNFFLTRWANTTWRFFLSLFRFDIRLQKTALAEGEELINEDDHPGLLDFLRPNRTPHEPRARIRFYYKKLLRKGAKNGLGRPKGMTPAEYANYLQSKLANPTEVASDLTTLTERFQEARYSPHPIVEEQAQQAQQSWHNLEPKIQKPEPPPPPSPEPKMSFD